ncbi:MAG: alpha-amylase family glycosyl hydrolase [Brevinematia bacterium]
MKRVSLILFLLTLMLVGILGCQSLPTLENIVQNGETTSVNQEDKQKPTIQILNISNYQIVPDIFSVLLLSTDNKDIKEIGVILPDGTTEIETNLEITISPTIVYSSIVKTIVIPQNNITTNEIKFFAKDSSGNYSLTNSIKVIVDRINPDINLVDLNDLQYVQSNLQLIFRAEDDTKVKNIYISLNNENFIELSYEGIFITNVSLPLGTNNIRYYSKDAVGRISLIKNLRIIVDANIPSVVITSPTNGSVFNTSNITISGISTVSSGTISNTYISINNSPFEEVGNQQNWTVNKTILIQGTNLIKVKVIDSLGKESTVSAINVFIDYTPPTLSFVYPLNNVNIVSENITVQGHSSDNYGVDKIFVKLNNGNFTLAEGTSNWFINMSIPIGTNTLIAYAVDKAGNISSNISITFVRISNQDGGSGGGGGDVSGTFPGNDPNNDPRDLRVYFVMSDRFVDGYAGNNNIYGDEYMTPNNDDETALRYYNGGDFKGLINNLDYIKNMGFNAIWITPVVKQPEGRYVNSGQSYDAAGFHGYWGYDFDSIDPHLESPGATFQDLINQAHSKGIKIILDVVPNHGHGGDAHPSVRWYNDRLKIKFDGQIWEYNQTNDPYYNNTNGVSDIWENSPGFFNYRGDYKLLDLLDFNECDPRTRQHIFNVYKKFIDMGVDGFRIDTVAYMRKQWWGIFADKMWEYAASKGKPWFWQVGEAWVATRSEALSYTTYSSRKAFSVLDLHGSCMDFPGQAKGVFAGGSGFEQMANIMSSDYSGSIDPTFLGTFVDNHDKPRFPGGYADNDSMVRMWRNALNWYFLARGIPIVYYGTEFEGTSDNINDYGAGEPKNRKYVGQDRINRVLANPSNYPIYQHLKLLNAIREGEISIRRGSQVNILLQGDLAIFKREYVTSVSYVFINKGTSSANYNIQLPNGSYKLLTYTGINSLSTNNVNVSSGSYSATIPANGFAIMVYSYPAPAGNVSLSVNGTPQSMNNALGNLWKTTINIASSGNVNLYITANYTNGSGTKTFGDTDEVGTFLPVSGQATETSIDPITFYAPVGGPYEVEFNDATLSYSIKYVGSTLITTIIVRSYVGNNNWFGVCGSYSPVTSYSDPENHVPNMAWWGNEPSTRMEFKGVDPNGRNIWVWTSTSIPSGKKIEFKPRRNGADWYPGANLSVMAGQSVDITYDWGLTTNEGTPDMNDTLPPSVSITYPSSNQTIINQTNITIYGTSQDNKSGVQNVYISLNSSPFVLANGTTSWNYTTNLSYGSHTLRVFAIDVSNNVSTTNQLTFTITNISSTSRIINYYSTWSSVNIHYNNGNGWTPVPGEPMSNIGNNWWRKTINIVGDSYSFVFNNNSGTWDNNDSKNYNLKLDMGDEFFVQNKIIGIGPTNSSSSLPVNVKIWYYRPDWTTVNIHYNNGSGWTAVPGVAMSNEGGGWWSKVITVVSNQYTFAFNNGSGTWDNNGGQNYTSTIQFTNIVR